MVLNNDQENGSHLSLPEKSDALGVATEFNDPDSQRALRIVIARNKLMAITPLLMSSVEMVGAESSALGYPAFGYVRNTAKQILPVFINSLMDTELMDCCMKSLHNDEEKARFMAAVNVVMRSLSEWGTLEDAKDSKVINAAEVRQKFNEDRLILESSMKRLVRSMDKMNDWQSVKMLLNSDSQPKKEATSLLKTIDICLQRQKWRAAETQENRSSGPSL